MIIQRQENIGQLTQSSVGSATGVQKYYTDVNKQKSDLIAKVNTNAKDATDSVKKSAQEARDSVNQSLKEATDSINQSAISANQEVESQYNKALDDYNQQVREFESTHVKLNNGDYVDKDEWDNLAQDKRDQLMTLGVAKYNQLQSDLNVAFGNIEAANQVKLDNGDVVSKASFDTLDSESQTKLKSLGIDKYNDYIKEQNDKVKVQQDAIKSISIPSYTTDGKNFDLVTMLKDGVTNKTLLDAGFDQSAIDEANNKLNNLKVLDKYTTDDGKTYDLTSAIKDGVSDSVLSSIIPQSDIDKAKGQVKLIQEQQDALDAIPSQYKSIDASGRTTIDVIGYLNDTNNAKLLIKALGEGGENTVFQALADIQNNYSQQRAIAYKIAPYATNPEALKETPTGINVTNLKFNDQSLIKFFKDNPQTVKLAKKDYPTTDFLVKVAGFDPTQVALASIKANGSYYDKLEQQFLTLSEADKSKVMGAYGWNYNPLVNITQLADKRVVETGVLQRLLPPSWNELYHEKIQDPLSRQLFLDYYNSLDGKTPSFWDAVQPMLSDDGWFALGLVPVLSVIGTVHNWDEVSSLGKGLSIAGDIINVIPFAGAALHSIKVQPLIDAARTAGKADKALDKAISQIKSVSLETAEYAKLSKNVDEAGKVLSKLQEPLNKYQVNSPAWRKLNLEIVKTNDYIEANNQLIKAQQALDKYVGVNKTIDLQKAVVNSKLADTKFIDSINKVGLQAPKNAFVKSGAVKTLVNKVIKLNSLSNVDLAKLEKYSGIKGLSSSIKGVNSASKELKLAWKNVDKIKISKGVYLKTNVGSPRYIDNLSKVQLAKKNLSKALDNYNNVLSNRVKPSPASGYDGIIKKTSSNIDRINTQMKDLEKSYKESPLDSKKRDLHDSWLEAKDELESEKIKLDTLNKAKKAGIPAPTIESYLMKWKDNPNKIDDLFKDLQNYLNTDRTVKGDRPLTPSKAGGTATLLKEKPQIETAIVRNTQMEMKLEPQYAKVEPIIESKQNIPKVKDLQLKPVVAKPFAVKSVSANEIKQSEGTVISKDNKPSNAMVHMIDDITQSHVSPTIKSKAILEVSDLTKQAMREATKNAGKTAEQINEAVMTLLNNQINVINDTRLKNLLKGQIKDITKLAVYNLTKTELQTKELLKTKLATKTKTQMETTIKTGIKEGLKIPPIVIIHTTDGKAIKLTREQILASVGWKQGFIYKMIYPPYKQKNILNTRKPIVGVPYYKDAGSAYRSLVKLGKGKLPPEINRTMGIVSISITTGESGKPKIRFTANNFPKNGSVGWKQGFIYKTIKAPYGQDDVINTAKPIEGIPYFEDARSAYKSIVQLNKGRLPPEIDLTMGFQNIKIKSRVGHKPTIRFKSNIRKSNKSSDSIRSVR